MSKRTQRDDLKQEVSRRIVYLINQYTEDIPGRQQTFAEMCGISKFSLSQYVNAVSMPGSVTAAKIGARCNVDPLWVMGMDVPMRTEDSTSMSSSLLLSYERLSPAYKQKVDNYIATLLQLQNMEDEAFTSANKQM